MNKNQVLHDMLLFSAFAVLATAGAIAAGWAIFVFSHRRKR